jgi:hypothetical protein
VGNRVCKPMRYAPLETMVAFLKTMKLTSRSDRVEMKCYLCLLRSTGIKSCSIFVRHSKITFLIQLHQVLTQKYMGVHVKWVTIRKPIEYLPSYKIQSVTIMRVQFCEICQWLQICKYDATRFTIT